MEFELDTIHCGECHPWLKSLPSESVHMVVTSPPYWGLRDYGLPPLDWPDGWRGSLGLEPTPELYVQHLVEIFREVKRVLRKDGTLWLNMGDSYASGTNDSRSFRRDRAPVTVRGRRPPEGLKPKDLCGIPWRVAFALQAAGWWLRSDIIWSKANPMPESVRDRPTCSHEYIFLLTKSAKYFYDAEAIKEQLLWPHETSRPTPARFGGANKAQNYPGFNRKHSGRAYDKQLSGRNKRSVWSVATQPYSGAHYSTFPPKLIEPCIKAGTSEHGCCPKCGAPWERIVQKERSFQSGSGRSGNMPRGKHGPNLQGGGSTLDVRRGPCVHSITLGWQPTCNCQLPDGNCQLSNAIVLDPFMGHGTTAIVARKLGRSYVGCELNPEDVEAANKRINQATVLPLFDAPEPRQPRQLEIADP